MVVARCAGAGFGLRDWRVFRAGDDNLPVQLTPYAGLPFILLVSWFLIDRFARTSASLEVTVTSNGGHCGYMEALGGPSWVDRRIADELAAA